MAIVPLTELLDFCDVGVWYFTIDESHDVLMLTSTGIAISIDVSDGIYLGSYLASELQDRASSGLGSTELTVAYSTVTKKFTITEASTSKTIAYTHKGSDAGLTFGFNQDHAAAESITSDVAAGDPSSIISVIHNSVEDWVEEYCGRKFEATLYVKERHDGIGQEVLYFDQYPVLAVNLDNLDWGSTGKTVTRNDGGSFVTDGFVAADKVLVQGSDLNSGLFTTSTGSSGVSALVMTFDETVVTDADDDNVILSHFRELWVNDDLVDEDDYEVNKDHIYYPGGFLEGHRNVRMTYYAGYSSSNMPKDLQLAIKIITKAIYQKRGEEIFGVKQYKVGDVSITCEDSDVPREALSILSKFKRILI
ncbi:hypothetical protein ES708_26196 [subsurface metagenome]